MDSTKALGIAAAIGAVAGLRSLMAPAAVSWAASSRKLDVEGPAVEWFASRTTAKVLMGLAIAELIADKLPFTPDRTEPASLALRIVSGSLCGAAISSAARASTGMGALLGGMAAVAGAFAGIKLRETGDREGLPALPVALAEDAIAVGAGVAAASAVRS